MHSHWDGSADRVTALETAGLDDEYAWELEEDKTPFERVCALPGRVYASVPPRAMRRAITGALDRLDPDAVAITSYSTPDAQAAVRWCRKNGRAAVLMLASKADDAPRVWWRERVKAALVRAYDAALVGGTPQRRYLASMGFPERRIFQPYNAVDNVFFAEGARSALRDRTSTAARICLPADVGPYFLCVCRLLSLKNVDGLIRAYAAYAASVAQPWPLVIVGDGPERGRLEEAARALEAGHVHFAGFQQKDRIAGFYALAGAFVLPSWKDTWGLVVNEAMAAGLPVLVSTKAGCHEDLVRPG
jgi:glycosyltransferase involved in cell wall biosynthesis